MKTKSIINSRVYDNVKLINIFFLIFNVKYRSLFMQTYV